MGVNYKGSVCCVLRTVVAISEKINKLRYLRILKYWVAKKGEN